MVGILTFVGNVGLRSIYINDRIVAVEYVIHFRVELHLLGIGMVVHHFKLLHFDISIADALPSEQQEKEDANSSVLTPASSNCCDTGARNGTEDSVTHA